MAWVVIDVVKASRCTSAPSARLLTPFVRVQAVVRRVAVAPLSSLRFLVSVCLLSVSLLFFHPSSTCRHRFRRNSFRQVRRLDRDVFVALGGPDLLVQVRALRGTYFALSHFTM